MRNGFLVLLISFFFGCSPAYSTLNSPKPAATQKNRLPEVQYYIDINQNGYTAVTLDENPMPSQGKDQWIRDLYTIIKYPAEARENGVSGVVILDVLIDQFGTIQEVSIKKSLSKECDEEALNAFKQATEKGYTPALYNSKSVKCRMDIPLGFWLG